MTSYRYLGYGTTDSNGVAHLSKNPSGQDINGYTSVGAGEIDIIASLDNPITGESIVSQEYSFWDTLVHDENVTASKTYAYNLEDRDFYCEFILHPSSTDSRGLLVFSQDINSNENIFIVGDLYGSTNNNCGINWTGGAFYGKQIPVDEDTKVTVTRNGASIVLTVGASTYTVSDMDLELNTLTRAFVENNSIRDFMLYLVPQTDRISIKSSANTIQTDDTPTITGRLHYNGEIVKNTNLDVYKNGVKVGTANTGSTGVASHTYTGTGAGETEFYFKYGSLVSRTFTVLDCFVHETEITASKYFNTDLEDSDFYCEFTVCPTDNNASAYIQINESANKYLQIGDLYGMNNNCGINWVGGTFYGKAIPLNEDTKVTVTRTGTNVVLTVGDSTYNITDMNIKCNSLYRAIIENNSIKDFMIYQIGSYDHILIECANPIIQSTENTNITGKLYIGGELKKNTVIDVYKNGTKVDTINTGSTGVASYTYSGNGVGEVEFQFKYGSIVSETYSILDCIKCDINNSLATTDYSLRFQEDSITIVDDYKDFSTSETSGRRAYLPVTTTGDVRIEMEIKYTTNGNIGIMGSDGTTLQYGQFNDDAYRNNWTKVVMVQTDGVISMTASTDGGSTWETKTLNNNDAISIARVLWTVTNGHCYFRNVKVYPI